MTSWGIDFAADIGCIAVFLVNGELVEMSTDRELNKRDPPGQTMYDRGSYHRWSIPQANTLT